MKEISLCKAQGIRDNEEVEDMVIRIIYQLPTQGSADLLIQQYGIDAKKLVDALYSVLPQGTLDRVWIEILKREASAYTGLKPTKG